MPKESTDNKYSIRTWNAISSAGLDLLDNTHFTVGEDIKDPDAILVRSHKLTSGDLSDSVLAVARAGAGYNNIPVSECTQKGIVVFNTPGANANSVKELVIAGMLLSSRGIHEGINWVTGQQQVKDLNVTMEKKKKDFAGTEISGKTLGVIGLGAIGAMVANTALALGMNVLGFDPFISVNSAWILSSQVQRCENLGQILSRSDYVSLHVPLTPETEGIINTRVLQSAKPGLRLLNFARAPLVDSLSIKTSLGKGSILRYITDFPTADLHSVKGVLSIPHLGASTMEAEDNCAAMAVRQLRKFLESGEIVNSVNFPSCTLEPFEGTRLLVVNKNIPNMLTQILETLAEQGLNIEEMVNRAYDDIAYNIIDISTDKLPGSLMKDIEQIDGVVKTRQITGNT